ncbi:hypothetical protein FJT64_016659 [Amphibalanus amphitrite]|uniref:Uncharacterized protein n=1 Tax=Amphibalanus amphitrite TaxID=1232801 RepID=A0A6A4XBM3_AMPAM|nr:hypothetical protein FJT64_016659 [Amphibalanus amphitrite]
MERELEQEFEEEYARELQQELEQELHERLEHELRQETGPVSGQYDDASGQFEDAAVTDADVCEGNTGNLTLFCYAFTYPKDTPRYQVLDPAEDCERRDAETTHHGWRDVFRKDDDFGNGGGDDGTSNGLRWWRLAGSWMVILPSSPAKKLFSASAVWATSASAKCFTSTTRIASSKLYFSATSDDDDDHSDGHVVTEERSSRASAR